MIKFSQKIFTAALIAKAGQVLSSNALMGTTMVGGMVQSGNIAKKQAAQNEEMMEQQKRLQKQTQKALEKVAVAAQKDPSKATQAAEVMQRYYSVPTVAVKRIMTAGKNSLQKGGQTVYEFGKALNNTGGGNQIIKKLGTGLAMGTTMAGGAYLVDKAIQKDREKITGTPITNQPPADPQKKKKSARKLLAGAAITAGTIVAARKGALGKGFKNLSHGLNSSGQKINKSATLKNLGQEYKKGFKEQFVTKNPETGKNKINLLGTGLTVGFAGMGGVSYIGERKQLKDQAKQQNEQRQYAENYQYQNESKKKGSGLKKALIGTAVAAGTIAAGRRGAFGAKTGRYLNDWYMSRGQQINKLSKGKYGNKMMESGSVMWDKFNKKAINNASTKLKNINTNPGKKGGLFDLFRKKENIVSRNQAKAEKLSAEINKYKNISGSSRLKDVKSGKLHTSLTNSVASGISKFYGTGGKKGTQEFLSNMAKDKSNSATTQKAIKFLQTGTGQTIATVGAVGVGSLAFKPFEWGDKVVRGASRAVDKNAFAYEKSKEQQVPE